MMRTFGMTFASYHARDTSSPCARNEAPLAKRLGSLVLLGFPAPLTGFRLVVGTGVDPVTFRFSGGRSAN
jgi:hypothetical protein